MERRIAIDGVELVCDDEGAGSPLVCLHAIGHGAADFAALRARLRSSMRVIALDWPGHGRSGFDRQPTSAARCAELTQGLLVALDLRDAVLMGNSIGGAAAIRVAACMPERVRALVLCNPGGLVGVNTFVRGFTRAKAAVHAAGGRGARWYPALFAAYYRTVLQRAAARTRRAEIVASCQAVAPRLAEAWRSFGEPEADIRALAPHVKQPVLFAWGAHDAIVALPLSRPAIRRFPNARVETFAAGHSPFLETPTQFERALERFLDEIGRV